MMTLSLVASAAASTLAQAPPMPPMTNGDGNPANDGMKHAMVTVDGAALAAHAGDPPATPVTMMSGFGVDYDAPFDVLEDAYFNSQYGWLPGEIIALPAGAEIWIRRTGATTPDGGSLRVFEGGMGGSMIPDPDAGVAGWSMTEIYQSDGDLWRWDLEMQHDLYVADKPGAYSMSFEVYFGDAATGEPIVGYEPGPITFSFVAVPEPTALTLLLAATPLAIGRRR